MTPPDATFKKGLALHQQGRFADAERLYTQALRQRPAHFDSLHLLGVIALQTGRSERGVDLIGKAITVNGRVAAAHGNRGNGLAALGRPEEAIASYDRAIALEPDYAGAHDNRGVALATLNRHEEALTSHDRAIALQPTLAEAHFNRGNVLLSLERPHEALDSFERAIGLRPDFADAHYNRANTLRAVGRPEQAIASCDRAIALKPDFPRAHYTRGNALRDLQRHEEAITSYDAAIGLNPDFAEAHWNRSLCDLAIGEYERGWAHHEWRWRAELAHAKPNLPGLPWLGDAAIDGKTVLVVAEQGMGDSLQFCRYAAMLGARAHVVLEVPRPLQRLLDGMEGVSRVIAAGDERPPFDVWTPMMSLPLAFRTTLATIPSAVPYLRARPEHVEAWRARLARMPGLKVGIVWAGSARLGDPRGTSLDSRRSISLQHLAPLGDIPGVCLVSLQKGEPAAQALTPPAGMVLHDWTSELSDFADTAALVDALDLVISIDTSVVHLAGALGKPVWVLNRFDQCWRWLRNREDSPWYPTARLFQQPRPGEWSEVIERVAEALRARGRAELWR